MNLALAGGVKAILWPGTAKYMVELGMLSASGRCSSFDASADGHVRGEGCGMLVLKRLADAQGDGDRVWATIRGTAINQNGASAGLTVPNGPAQEQVIETALARAGIVPSEVDYLEAHATGSALGDPIEVQAAAAVYGRGRDAGRPLLIGTAKANIGHLEAAAGIAGLIKAVLAMQRGSIPKQLHFHNPNPQLDWDGLPVRVVSEATEWPPVTGRPRRAGVSAFAISGTNAHVVVEGYGSDGAGAADAGAEDEEFTPAGAARPVEADPGDAAPESASGLRPTLMLPLSGKSHRALVGLAERYRSWLDARPDGPVAGESASESQLSDLAWTAAVGRSHFGHRAGVVFRDAQSLRERLSKLCQAGEGPESGTPARIAFAFSEDVGRWAGTGETLHRSEPVARSVLERCETAFRECEGASLLGAMFGRAGSGALLDDPAWSQPALYALECALVALWSSVGVRPGVVFGQGTGEVAAGQAAGMFGLEDGLRLAAARGRLLGTPPQNGAQSGALAGLQDTLAGVAMSPVTLTFVSGTTGRASRPGDALENDYWQRQSVEPFELGVGVTALAGLEVDALVEIGPKATLAPAIRDAWPRAAGRAAPAVVTSLRRAAAEGTEATADDIGFAAAAAEAYEAGIPLRFEGLFAGEARRRIALPGYPFQRGRFWIDTGAR